jgi:hypothetical protein
MSISRKYGRTYHYDFSPGTTSDDRINSEWKSDMEKIKSIVHTEKMDGENSCLNSIGVFARSHAAPTRHPWSEHLKVKHSMIQQDLKANDLEIFGENIYAIHSIIYPKIENHFYVFGMRINDMWLSWEEVKWHANFFDFEVVPELLIQKDFDVNTIQSTVEELTSKPSTFDSFQNNTDPLLPCTMEGVVTRNVEEYSVNEFRSNVFKWVRKDHVQTDVHWSKNIKRAMLKHEIDAINKK